MEDDELPAVWVHRHHHGRLLFAILGIVLVGIVVFLSVAAGEFAFERIGFTPLEFGHNPDPHVPRERRRYPHLQGEEPCPDSRGARIAGRLGYLPDSEARAKAGTHDHHRDACAFPLQFRSTC